jgi:hypothetical protein
MGEDMTDRYRVTEALVEWESDPVARRRQAAIKVPRERYAGVPG